MTLLTALGVLLPCLWVGLHPRQQTAVISQQRSPQGLRVIWSGLQFQPNSSFQPRIQWIESRMQKEMLPLLPERILQAIQGATIQVTVTRDCPRDGAFIDPEKATRNLSVCIRSSILDSDKVFALVAHEVFHAIHFLIHPDEPTWIREGLALWMEWRASGAFNPAFFSAGIYDISTPLMGIYDFNHPNPGQYGHDLLYFYYLWSQCGGDELLWTIAEGLPSLTGSENIDRILHSLSAHTKLKQCSSFIESALNFEVARIHSKRVGPESDARYYLTSGSPLLKPKSRDHWDQVEWKTWPVLSPYLIEGAVKIPTTEIGHSVREFWLGQSYPFEVLEQQPADKLVSFHRILIKLPVDN